MAYCTLPTLPTRRCIPGEGGEGEIIQSRGGEGLGFRVYYTVCFLIIVMGLFFSLKVIMIFPLATAVVYRYLGRYN